MEKQTAFYSGWPKAWSAFALINEVYADDETQEIHGGAFGNGAKKDSWFSHIAVEVPGENTVTEWCEEVTDEEYNKL